MTLKSWCVIKPQHSPKMLQMRLDYETVLNIWYTLLSLHKIYFVCT